MGSLGFEGYCAVCGTLRILRVPEGDNRNRLVCPRCDHIEYINPKIVVGCIPVWCDRILLCKRATPPQVGFWGFPAGYMEMNESAIEGAARETLEESEAKVIIEPDDLISVTSVLDSNQVHMVFKGHMLTDHHSTTEESSETMLITPDGIPWGELAFDSVTVALDRFLNVIYNGGYNTDVYATVSQQIIKRG